MGWSSVVEIFRIHLSIQVIKQLVLGTASVTSLVKKREYLLMEFSLLNSFSSFFEES